MGATETVKPSTVSKTTKAAKAALTKHKKKKAFTPADTALNRALAPYIEHKDGIKDCLLLTSTEILILTVLASQGLPVFSDDWSSLLSDTSLMEDSEQEGSEEGYRINFATMAGITEVASEVWKQMAERKLRAEILLHDDSQTIPEKDQQRIAVLQKDLTYKKMTLQEVTSYKSNVQLFARKCVALIEALRKNMGSVDLSQE